MSRDESAPPVPPELKALVGSIRADRLSDERVQRVAAALGPLLTAAAVASAASATTSAATTATAATTAAAGEAAKQIATPLLQAKLIGLGAVLLVAAGAVTAYVMHTDNHAGPSTSASAPIVAPSSAQLPDVAPESASAQAPAPSVSAASSSAVNASAKPVANASASPEPATEEELLGRARAEMGRSPASALALTAQHAKRFPGGSLSQEREQIAIEALVALGRRSQAQDRARRFATIWPRSPYVERLRLRGLID
jgi:hypothetical protein